MDPVSGKFVVSRDVVFAETSSYIAPQGVVINYLSSDDKVEHVSEVLIRCRYLLILLLYLGRLLLWWGSKMKGRAKFLLLKISGNKKRIFLVKIYKDHWHAHSV